MSGKSKLKSRKNREINNQKKYLASRKAYREAYKNIRPANFDNYQADNKDVADFISLTGRLGSPAL